MGSGCSPPQPAKGSRLCWNKAVKSPGDVSRSVCGVLCNDGIETICCISTYSNVDVVGGVAQW